MSGNGILLYDVVDAFGELSRMEANDVLSACIALGAMDVEPAAEGIMVRTERSRVISTVSAGLAAYYTCTSVLIDNGYNTDTAANTCSHVVLLALLALGCRTGMMPEDVSSVAARVLENAERIVEEVTAAGFDMTKTLPCAVIERAYGGLHSVKPLLQAGCKGGGNVELVREVSRRLSWVAELED
ncbi:MAG: hypothetical protein GSR78_01495 [Desulfurococcales archaeon]|nr:hypothetical protein [Desulfurococcales archaeon]